MTTTIDTITDEQIEALLIEAKQAGDDPMVEVCRKALGRHGAVRMTRDEARAECARVIADAEAMQD